MRRIILLTILIALGNVCFADGQSENWWEKGNDHFQKKEYDSAAYYYKLIIAEQPENSSALYNLGNSYYRLNDIGNAILYYEKTLKYNPGHKQATDNLALTQSRVNNRIQPLEKIFFLRWWQNITAGNLSNTYAVLAAILFILSIGYIITKRIGVHNIDLRNQLIIGSFVICGILILLSLASAQNIIGSNHAIVMQEEAPLMPNPKNTTSKSLIPEGTKVEICEEQASWYEVKLPDGRTGWLEKELLAII